MHWCLIYTQAFSFLKNIKISTFGGISKFPKLIVFGQFWADSSALPMVDSMPSDGLKTLKPIILKL
jgi:hypothetical protein